MMIKLDLTLPPSVNALWTPIHKGYKKAGIIRSAEYTSWLNLAGREILIQKPRSVKGKYCLELYFNEGLRGDIDNRVKAINDILQKYKVIENDKFNKRLVVDFYKCVTPNVVGVWVMPYDPSIAHYRNLELEKELAESRQYEFDKYGS